MTFQVTFSRHWQGLDMRLRMPYGVYASWLVLGWLTLSVIPAGLFFTPLLMSRKYAREWGGGYARGLSLFVSVDNPFRYFAPARGWHGGGMWRALALPFISLGVQFVGWPLAVHANYR